MILFLEWEEVHFFPFSLNIRVTDLPDLSQSPTLVRASWEERSIGLKGGSDATRDTAFRIQRAQAEWVRWAGARWHSDEATARQDFQG